MGSIRDIHNPWRDALQPASFRGVIFFVEVGVRAGGRRAALHEYPKRNDPYAEDMGRAARHFVVQGYLIGPNYLSQKDRLIDALEDDGPGMLQMPFPIRGGSGGGMKVQVGPYQITETRERGGMCGLEMDFFEYGTPVQRSTQSTAGNVNNAAVKVETTATGIQSQAEAATANDEAKQYTDIYASVPSIGASGSWGGGALGSW